MRYIDIQSLKEEKEEQEGEWPPKDWQERARKVTEELRKAPDSKARSEILNKRNNHIWSELKQAFRDHFYNKCWYCEAKTDRMLGDMDHYRPKGRVAKVPHHPGYWWLAYDWRNFRYSCEWCNRNNTDPSTGTVGGKQDHFPLVDESCRVMKECAYKGLLQEDPVLLDPTDTDDPLLLSFQSDGRPGPASKDKKSFEYKRATESIKIYHLDHIAANRRRRDIYRNVHRLVDRCQTYYLLWQKDRNDLAAQMGFKDTMSELRKMMACEAEYSSAAKIYVSMYRKARPGWAWVDRLVSDAS